MASEGPNSPDAADNDVSYGTEVWANPTNILASDNAYATVTVTAVNTTSVYLKATDYDFVIPVDATVVGIVVEIERKDSGGLDQVRDDSVRIVKSDGSFGTENKADTGTDWPDADAYATYGSSGDLWSEVWTPADVNNIKFGAVLSAKYQGGASPVASVDHIRITVHYTLAAAYDAGMNAAAGVVCRSQTREVIAY